MIRYKIEQVSRDGTLSWRIECILQGVHDRYLEQRFVSAELAGRFVDKLVALVEEEAVQQGH